MVLPQYHLDAVTSKQFGPFNEVLDYTGSSPNVILVDFSGLGYGSEYTDYIAESTHRATFFDTTFLLYVQTGLSGEALDYTGSSPNVILVDFSGYAYAVEPFYPIAQIVTPKYPGNGDNIGYF